MAPRMAQPNSAEVIGWALGSVQAQRGKATVGVKAYTICVRAHGLHKPSPKANAALAEQILDSGGAWASEYPPGVEPRKEY